MTKRELIDALEALDFEDDMHILAWHGDNLFSIDSAPCDIDEDGDIVIYLK